jgi:thiamine pyrophosphate-dependent acetolactate synthase large subunit-like protein
LPWSLQAQVLTGAPPALGAWQVAAPTPSLAVIDAILDALATGTSALWIGHGARHASAALRAFAIAAGLPVIASPRAKGVFDETHSLFVGVSGAGGHATVDEFLARRPDTLFVLGTRLGEVTSFLAPAAIPARRWIHVDVDATAFAAAFPGTDGLGVVAEVGAVLEALDARARATGWYQRRGSAPPRRASRGRSTWPRAPTVPCARRISCRSCRRSSSTAATPSSAARPATPSPGPTTPCGSARPVAIGPARPGVRWATSPPARSAPPWPPVDAS